MDESTQSETVSPTMDAAALPAAIENAAVWQARAAYLQAQAQRASDANAALQDRVLTLEAQLSALQEHAANLQTRLGQTQSLLDVAAVQAAAAPRLGAAAPQPPIVHVSASLPRSADPSNQYTQRPLAQIRQLVLHHSGSDDLSVTPQQMAEAHTRDLRRQWPGIGFHFFIAADGAIYQTNRLETVCFHVADNNATSAGIVLVGQFDNCGPPAAQMSSTAALLAWLLQELRVPLQSIVGHSEFAAQQTTCPGAGWQTTVRWKETLLGLVDQRRRQTERRTIYHYLLLWQTETAWAEADWKTIACYVGRFRPAIGFSAEEARQAENVTIIGGPAGVPTATEEMLRAAGCRVQRVAGKNARETRLLLDTMARDGQRFVSVQ